MKKQFLYLFGFLALTACTDDEDVFSGGEIAEPVITPENKPNDVVTGDVFAKLNLDYPGLEKVKQHYEADEQYYAALALLDYYRNRNISNPEVDLITPSPTDGEKRMADQALEENGYRFRVGTFVEEGTAGQSDAVYYSFDNGDAGINWNMEPEGTSREFSYQQHRWQWMEAQAETYRSTRNETYIQSWIDVYNSWLNAFPCPNVKFDDPRVNDSDYKNDSYQWKGLQTAERVLTMVNILPYYIYSDNFTPELLTTFLNSFADHVEMVRLNYYSDGNIRIMKAENAKLAEANERLRRLFVQMPEIIREEETLAMKLRVHDDIGHSILAARRVLLQNTDQKEIRANAALWEQSISVLYRSSQITAQSEPLEAAKKRAEELGVSVLLTGNEPQRRWMRTLSALAICECAANCVRHIRI